MSNKINETKTSLPKLRFPEFHGEWEYQKLADIASVITEKAGNGKYTLMSITSGVGLVSQIEKFGREIAGQAYKNYFVIRENDFAYNKSSTKDAPEGFIAMYSGKEAGAVPNSIFTCFRTQKDKVIPKYLSYLFLGNLHGRWLRNFITVGARAHGSLNVDGEDLMSLPVPLPNLPEQQKIADCLTSLDDLIAAQSQKVEALQIYKKGLMQNLFPAEGESVPRLRFPEFQSAGEWETAILSELYTFKSTNSFSRDQLNYISGSVKNIHYGDIHTKFSTLFDITKEKVPYINPSQSIETIKVDSYCVEGDIVFADASEDLNDVGKSIEIVNLNNEKIVSGMHTLLARQITPKLAIGFGGYLFKTERVRTQIKKEAQGAKVLGISSGRLSSIKICYPSNKKEQQRIAELLTAIDKQISAQREAVEALKVHKKGLMQGLFASGGGAG